MVRHHLRNGVTYKELLAEIFLELYGNHLHKQTSSLTPCPASPVQTQLPQPSA